MVKVQLTLVPCPWCGKTPEIRMPLCDTLNTGGTWIWSIGCWCTKSSINTSIRNTTKTNPWKIAAKLKDMAERWNNRVYKLPYEHKIIDLDDLNRSRR